MENAAELLNLKDKKVVVTGGSRGLGLGLVEALVARGARVTVVARSADALESVRARLDVARASVKCASRMPTVRVRTAARMVRNSTGDSAASPCRPPKCGLSRIGRLS